MKLPDFLAWPTQVNPQAGSSGAPQGCSVGAWGLESVTNTLMLLVDWDGMPLETAQRGVASMYFHARGCPLHAREYSKGIYGVLAVLEGDEQQLFMQELTLLHNHLTLWEEEKSLPVGTFVRNPDYYKQH